MRLFSRPLELSSRPDLAIRPPPTSFYVNKPNSITELKSEIWRVICRFDSNLRPWNEWSFDRHHFNEKRGAFSELDPAFNLALALVDYFNKLIVELRAKQSKRSILSKPKNI